MDSIKKVSIGELKVNKEELLNSMKGLVHTAKDIFGSTPFKDEYIAVGTDHILTIEVGGSIYPVHYTPNTMVMLDGDLSITDYIFDEENYLSLSDDDDMKWFSLVMQLAHQIDLLQNENNQYREDLTTADNDINELETKLKDKDERINQMSKNNTALSAENKNISDLLKEADRNVRFYAREVDDLEKQIKDLQSKALSDKDDMNNTSESIEMDMETAMLLQENTKLKADIQSLKETNQLCGQYIDRTAALLEENYKLKEENQTIKDVLRGRIREYDKQLSILKKQKEEAELLAYRLTRGDMHVQFDSMESLKHENEVLKHENADLNQKLFEKFMHATYSTHGEEPEEENKE